VALGTCVSAVPGQQIAWHRLWNLLLKPSQPPDETAHGDDHS
jgi:hypothetical protein